jgi:uncharacterized YigZ family protein
MSDDGEPHGTAGRPMLSVLLHSDIGEIVAVVTRYYGGVKLGTGGLVRAYSGSVKSAIEGLALEEKRDLVSLTVAFGYSKITSVKQKVESFGAEITGENYGADVSFEIELPRDKKDGFIRAITDLTRGEIRISD